MPVPAGSATMVTGASRARVSQAARRMVEGESEAPSTATAVTGERVCLVQDGGELDPPVRQPGPGEVGVAGFVGGPDVFQCLVGVGFVRGVGDPAVRDPADGGFAGVLGCPVRPPGHDRGVREEQGRDEGFAFVGEFAVAAQHDHFGGAGVPADPDLGVEPVRGLRAGVGEDDDPAGVFPAGFVRGLDRFFLEPGCGDDHRVRTRPRAITPPCSRRDMSFLETFEVVVSGKSTIMAFSRFVRHGPAAHRRWRGPRTPAA